MNSKLFKPFLLIFILNFSLQNSIFASIATGTLVKTPQGLVPVENLKVNDKVVTPNFNKLISEDSIEVENPLLEIAITNISSSIKDNIVTIKTDKGNIQTDEDQLFYEFQSRNFIKAKDIKPENLFINFADNTFDFCQCIEIEKLNTPTLLYEITLEKPHIFFASDAQIIIHNFTDPITIGIEIAFGSTIGSIAWAGITVSLGWLGIKVGKKSLKRLRKQRRKGSKKQH